MTYKLNALTSAGVNPSSLTTSTIIKLKRKKTKSLWTDWGVILTTETRLFLKNNFYYNVSYILKW